MSDSRHALYDLIERRRDVRAEFSGEQVDPAVLDRLLGAAHAAPSVGHSQPWDFVVVRDTTTLARFQSHVAAERAAYAASLPDDRRATLARIKVEGVLESRLGVVVTYDPDRGGPQVLGQHTIADTGLYSTCLAVQNLWLAATAERVGVGWVSFFREEFLRDLLGIPDRIRPIAWLCVGPVNRVQEVPDLERHGWRQRRPLADVIHHDTWRK